MISGRRPLTLALGLVALAGATGCQLAHDLLPRTHTSSTSPDGRYYAYVRQHLNPDPPDDHLYLGAVGTPARHLMALAPDADWCRTIVWTPDSRAVGFLIRDQRLAIFDVRSMTPIETVVLVPADGYPGSQEARNVALANDGTITFERVVRPTMRLHKRRTGETAEVPVTRSGTYGRPIERPERSLGIERLRVSLDRKSVS